MGDEAPNLVSCHLGERERERGEPRGIKYSSSVDLERGNPLAYPSKGTRDQSVNAKQAMAMRIFFFFFLFAIVGEQIKGCEGDGDCGLQ